MNNFLYSISEVILNSITVAVVLGALIAGYLGFYSYRKQKIWENINKRYFEEGIEGLIDYFNNIRMTIEYNYVENLNVLQHFRDFNEENFKKWFSALKLNLERISPGIPKYFLVVAWMFENKKFNELFLKLFVDLSYANNFFASEIPLAINNYIEKVYPNKARREELAKIHSKDVKEKFEEVYKKKNLYSIIEKLDEILLRLRELNIDSYNKLKKVKNDKIINKLLLDIEGLQ